MSVNNKELNAAKKAFQKMSENVAQHGADFYKDWPIEFYNLAKLLEAEMKKTQQDISQ